MLTEKLHKGKGVVFVHFEKLTVPEVEALRRDLKKNGVYYTVAKKTVLRRAFEAVGLAVDPTRMNGNFGTAVNLEDETAAARVMAEFGKTHEPLQMIGGTLEGKWLEAREVAALAKMPSKTELLSRLVGTINAPVSGLVTVLHQTLAGFVRALNAIKNVKVE